MPQRRRPYTYSTIRFHWIRSKGTPIHLPGVKHTVSVSLSILSLHLVLGHPIAPQKTALGTLSLSILVMYPAQLNFIFHNFNDIWNVIQNSQFSIFLDSPVMSSRLFAGPDILSKNTRLCSSAFLHAIKIV